MLNAGYVDPSSTWTDALGPPLELALHVLPVRLVSIGAAVRVHLQGVASSVLRVHRISTGRAGGLQLEVASDVRPAAKGLTEEDALGSPPGIA